MSDPTTHASPLIKIKHTLCNEQALVTHTHTRTPYSADMKAPGSSLSKSIRVSIVSKLSAQTRVKEEER